MNSLVLSPPTFGFVVGTRAALAFGLGLLLADRIPASRRRRIGLTLLGIGVATTIPAAMAVFGGKRIRSARLSEVTRFPRKGDDENLVE